MEQSTQFYSYIVIHTHAQFVFHFNKFWKGSQKILVSTRSILLWGSSKSVLYIYLLSLIFMVPFVSVVYKSWLIIYYLFFFSLKNTYVLSSREFTVVSACFRTPHPPLPSLVHHPKHLTTFSQRFIQRCKVIRVHLRHTLMSNHSFWLTSG